MSLPTVEAHDVSLVYRLQRDRAGTIKEFAVQALKRQIQRDELWAVRELSFQLEQGEVLGVIGPNGAGKSTLMKIVARVLPPTHGRVIVRGRVAPLIQLGAGFNTELTAVENIVLYGTLLGRDSAAMRERVDDICEWAGLTEFKYSPIRTYSSGMLARLGFAVATDVEPDILVVDEVLAVGDDVFRKKSRERITAMIGEGTSVLFVSHDLQTVRAISNRVMWIDHGSIQMMGEPAAVVKAYEAR